jgi:hypothetical protein
MLVKILSLREKESVKARTGYPYPTVHDILIKKIDEEGKNLAFTLTTAFLRKYCVVVLGDAGWKNNNSTGHEPVPREKEFARIWHERGIDFYTICEFRTSMVNYYFSSTTII